MIASLKSNRPTESQKRWLASVFGHDLWEELTQRSDFRHALETSIDLARRIGLRYLAAKEIYQRTSRID
jgi:hypothetical protein